MRPTRPHRGRCRAAGEGRLTGATRAVRRVGGAAMRPLGGTCLPGPPLSGPPKPNAGEVPYPASLSTSWRTSWLLKGFLSSFSSLRSLNSRISSAQE
jgi:hypothetical protein